MQHNTVLNIHTQTGECAEKEGGGKQEMEHVVVFPPPLLLPSSSKQAINMEILKARENSECSPSC